MPPRKPIFSKMGGIGRIVSLHPSLHTYIDTPLFLFNGTPSEPIWVRHSQVEKTVESEMACPSLPMVYG